LKSLLKDKTKS